MSLTFHSVRGEFRVDGPGARRVPVRLDGRVRSLRIEVGAGWPALAKLGRGRVTHHLSYRLRRGGLSVTVVLNGRPTLELGRVDRSGVKLRLLAALRALVDVPLRELPQVLALGLDLLRGAPEPVPIPASGGTRRTREARRG